MLLLRRARFPYRTAAVSPDHELYCYDTIPVEEAVVAAGGDGLPGTVLRLGAIYGPGDRQHRMFEYLKRMLDRRPFILLDQKQAQWRWTRFYVENAAAAVALAVTDARAAGRTYNIGQATALTELGSRKLPRR